MNVSGLGELSWKTDVFGVLGEFRSEFRSASAPLAQSVEQRTFNPQVLGSSPRGRTTCNLLSPAEHGFAVVQLSPEHNEQIEDVFTLPRSYSVYVTHQVVSL